MYQEKCADHESWTRHATKCKNLWKCFVSVWTGVRNFKISTLIIFKVNREENWKFFSFFFSDTVMTLSHAGVIGEFSTLQQKFLLKSQLCTIEFPCGSKFWVFPIFFNVPRHDLSWRQKSTLNDTTNSFDAPHIRTKPSKRHSNEINQNYFENALLHRGVTV